MDDLIVLCATNHYDNMKMADQHLSEELAKLGPVLYVDPPLSCLAPLRDRAKLRQLSGPRLRRQAANLVRLTPVVGPLPGKPGVTDLTVLVLREYLRRAVARLRPGNVRAVISTWPNFPVFGACGEQVSLYWAKDDFVGGAALLGLNPGHLAKYEDRVANAAEFIVAANPTVAESWRDKGHETLLIPFGAAVGAYADVESAPLPADVHLPDPIVGFVGQLNSRMDFRLLEAVADRGLSLLLIGPKDPKWEPERFGRLAQRPNVQWTGYRQFSALPGYLRRIAIGIVPYGDSAFNRGSFPLKTLEYLAAGRPVVSTDLPATRWLATDLIGIASEPGPFAALVDRMTGEAGDRGLMARRREFAAEHSYAVRAAQFHEAIRVHQQDRQPENLSVTRRGAQ